jgi:D-alanine--poly(phosphoribitol) ligase subunit 1
MQKNLGEYLLFTAESNPDKLAVEDNTSCLTYFELLYSSIILSDALESAGVKRNIPILILIPKSCEAVIGITATTLSGGVYVPVDVASPLPRLRSVYDQLGGGLIMCTEATLNKAQQLEVDAKKIVCLSANIFDKKPTEELGALISKARSRIRLIIDQDPCYVIFTSGSTGIPKGVTIAHRSVIDYIEWAKSEYPINKTHRIASQAPFYFDNSTLDLYLAFSTGASLHLPSDNIYAFPKLTIEYLINKKITTIFWVPSVLVSVANSGLLEQIRPSSLQHVLFAGEQMPVPQINIWVRALPGVLFSNLYGPTEITVDCTSYTFYKSYEGDLLPIGYACRNTDLLIINEFRQECIANEIGELFVRGCSLSLGYWNDKLKSDSAFIQNPLENRFRDLVYRTGDLVRRDELGCITFLGRKDTQIKLNGYRIELGELEAGVAKVSGIARSAALLDAKRKIIVLFVEMKQGYFFDLALLRRELTQLIPKYMMPGDVIVVPGFDHNQNGKIDRIKLAKILEKKS